MIWVSEVLKPVDKALAEKQELQVDMNYDTDMSEDHCWQKKW